MDKIELTAENVKRIEEILAVASSDSNFAQKALRAILALGKPKATEIK